LTTQIRSERNVGGLRNFDARDRPVTPVDISLHLGRRYPCKS
jgi:hypothetical protein